MSDVRLTDRDVVLEGHRVSCVAADLVLDHPERRGADARNGVRRAIVHNPDDGLTINWGEDYPGGVTLLGTVTINELSVKLKQPRRWVDVDPGRWRIGAGGTLEEVRGDVTVRVESSVDVADELQYLREMLLELKQELAGLRGQIP